MKALAIALAATALVCAEDYKLGPDSERHEGVPKGTITQAQWTTSKVFPGTTRDYWVYVPAQYKGDKPAALMVFQDGSGFVKEDGGVRATVVMDNLIARGEMPVTIGLFINPGVLPARNDNQQGRFNRSFEYDSMSDRYSRFLLDEIIPEISKKYKISSDPNDRGIGGSSSGAICALNVAWQRPDQFRRVLSWIGSYTDLRGADIFPALVRKTEAKPIRIFLQDGKNDLNIYSGSWYHANQSLAAALEYAGYDYKFVVGEEGHNSKHGASILPDAMRWLWRDYGKPVPLASSKVERRYAAEIVDPDHGWELVSEGHQFTEGPAVDKNGNLFFTDTRASKIWKIGADGKRTVFKEDSGGAIGMTFGVDGKLYVCQNGKKRIVSYTPDGTESVIAEGLGSNDIAITTSGNLYVSDPGAKTVWLIKPGGEKKAVHEGMTFPNGVRLSADQSLLWVADSAGRSVWSFSVEPDGTLSNGEPFYRMELPEEMPSAGADGMAVDTEGYLWVATRYGLMVCDQPGRVTAILNKPQQGPLAHVAFGGPDLQTIYVCAGDKIYKRPVRRKGVPSWTAMKPPTPRL